MFEYEYFGLRLDKTLRSIKRNQFFDIDRKLKTQ